NRIAICLRNNLEGTKEYTKTKNINKSGPCKDMNRHIAVF
ncbi:hypothetical protein ECPA39_1736, partial [Escherichia coli PA39]